MGSKASVIRGRRPNVVGNNSGFVNRHGELAEPARRPLFLGLAARFPLRGAVSGGGLLSALSADLAAWRSLDADQIAVLLAAPLFTRILFTPAISFAADWLGDRRRILIGLAWGSLVSFLLLWAAGGFFTMLLATVLLAINWTTIMPLIETVAVSGIRSRALDYGRVRLWGSISFIVASLVAGFVIGGQVPAAVMPLLVGAAALMMFGVHLLPRELAVAPRQGRARLSRAQVGDAVDLVPRAAVSACSSSRRAWCRRATRSITASARCIGARRASPTARSARCGRWAWSPRWRCSRSRAASSRSSGAARLLMLAGLAATLRWAFMAIDPPLLATALLQMLHALSFGAAHIAAIHFMAHAVPFDRAATAQGLYAAIVAGLVLGLVTHGLRAALPDASPAKPTPRWRCSR